MKLAAMMLAGAALLSAAPPAEVRLIVLDPGHFHAGLIQKEMYPGVSKRVAVYAPLGPDLIAHLNRIAAFNLRVEKPTAWELDVHTGPDFLADMLRDRPGNVVVFSGRNAAKIARIQASIEAGLHVLADKPWIIRGADLPRLQAALDAADRRRLAAYDIMTERYEITSILLRELTLDEAVYGKTVSGTASQPAVYMESVHHIYKAVAGIPNLRPVWFFDVLDQGEGLTDVGTHLVDLVQWTLFPDQALDYRRDVEMGAAERWPTAISRDQFRRVTGAAEFPAALASHVRGDSLRYFCNNTVNYKLRGVHVRLDVLWRYEAPAGTGDTHLAIFRGSRARLEIRQGREENFRPELYVVPEEPSRKAALATALGRRLQAWKDRYPGLSLEDLGARIRVNIPDRYRVGHEAHFAQVVTQYLSYFRNPASMPAWEKPGMLVKYFITTKGVESARTVASQPPR